MVELIREVDPDLVAQRLEGVREATGDGVEILVACKYVPLDQMGALSEAGVALVGENRLQDLEAKHAEWGDRFVWDFIGTLQSKKIKKLLPLVRLIHSVASESALDQLGKHGDPDTEVLLEVDLAGEESKAGIQPEAIADFIDRCPVTVSGLMTMPPYSEDPESSRPYFAELASLGAEHGLSRLSMGTSQDWKVAVEEGSTIIRLGSSLLR